MKKWDDKLILSDGDGVLIDWEWPFRIYMESHGHRFDSAAKSSYNITRHYPDTDPATVIDMIREFNNSHAIGYLPPHRDSVHYVNILHREHGFRFRVITSLGLDPNAKRLREMNLKKLFGDAIESVVVLDTGADKDHVLEPYRNSGLPWIEDKTKNADLGHSLGLRSILVEHGFNRDDAVPYPKVKTWQEISQILTAE